MEGRKTWYNTGCFAIIYDIVPFLNFQKDITRSDCSKPWGLKNEDIHVR